MFSYQDIWVDRVYFERLVLRICPLGSSRTNSATSPRDDVVYYDLRQRDIETSPQHTTTAQQFAQWVRRQTAKEKKARND